MKAARKFLCFSSLSFALGGVVGLPAAHATTVPPEFQWHIKSTTWSATDEKRYEEFVSILGRAVKKRRCWTVIKCLKNKKANPFYHASDAKSLKFFADCADLPYVLRAYFAWKNNLPFSYAYGLAARPGSSGDVRYSRTGNSVSSRKDVVQTSADKPIDVRKVLIDIRLSIHTGHFRILHKGNDRRLPDYYPVKIAPGSIRPGTVIYDPNGHVAVVYDVTKNGRVLFIDAHPDNSLTQGSYGKRFTQRAKPDSAPGFKNWRKITLNGATLSSSGNYIGGKVEVAANEDIRDFSTEQFYGTEPVEPKRWTRRRFKVSGKRVGWYDYVRTLLAGRELRYKPVEEFNFMLEGLCSDLIYRADSVNIAIAKGLHKKPQPARLPKNIYGTTGEWETYSTPSRDARLKTSFKELRDSAERFLKMHERGDRKIDYQGSDLRADLLQAYKAAGADCSVEYKNSDGKSVELSFQQVTDRLFKLSFDPYHCVERRWGATQKDELASCSDRTTKRAWYDAEQRLRNQIERKYDAKMDFNLPMLKKAVRGSGVDEAPNVDVLTLLGGRDTDLQQSSALEQGPVENKTPPKADSL